MTDNQRYSHARTGVAICATVSIVASLVAGGLNARMGLYDRVAINVLMTLVPVLALWAVQLIHRRFEAKIELTLLRRDRAKLELEMTQHMQKMMMQGAMGVVIPTVPDVPGRKDH